MTTQDTRYTLNDWVRQRDLATIFQGLDNSTGQPAFIALLTDMAAGDRRVLDALTVELPLLQEGDRALLCARDYNLETPPLYVMVEMLEGISLRQLVDSAGRGLMPTEALAYCAQAARCLQVLHEKGVAHGAVHIDSFVLRGGSDGSDMALITPWAASIFGADLFVTDDFLIQREPLDYHVYAPPEHATRMGQPPTASGDIYALGILIFHLLTGVAPGVAPGNPEAAPWLSGGKTPPLGESIADATVRARLQKLIQIATSRDPTRRWPDLKTFLAALEQINPGGTMGVPRINATLGRPPAPDLVTSPDLRVAEAAPLEGTSQPAPPTSSTSPIAPPPPAQSQAQPQAQPRTCYLFSAASGTVYMANATRAIVGVARDGSFVPDVNLAMEPAAQAQYVSHHHLDLIYDEGKWYVQPSMVARNPTFLNGQQVYPGTSQPLFDGAELEIPALRLQFRFDPGSARNAGNAGNASGIG